MKLTNNKIQQLELRKQSYISMLMHLKTHKLKSELNAKPFVRIEFFTWYFKHAIKYELGITIDLLMYGTYYPHIPYTLKQHSTVLETKEVIKNRIKLIDRWIKYKEI